MDETVSKNQKCLKLNISGSPSRSRDRRKSDPSIDVRNDVRSGSYNRSQSTDELYRSVRVLSKVKCKTRVTLMLSPDNHLAEVNNDFELRFHNAKPVQETSTDQIKSYQFYTDSGTPVTADLIFKENGKEVHKIYLHELQQWQEHKYGEVRVTVSPVETKTPELRTYKTEKFLCEKEQEFLKKRKQAVKEEIKKLFNDAIHEEDVPNIALMGSGGGYRAMIAMSGVINALYDTKLLNTIMYSAALSGSSWYLAVLYSYLSWPNIDPREVQQLLRKDITTIKHETVKILCGAAWSWVKSFCKREKWNLTSDIFGPLLGKSLISDRMECKWSEQERTVKDGKVPLPLLAAICVEAGKDVKKFHEWVEFSPYEVNFYKYGAAIDMKHFGRQFQKGFVEGKEKELPLYQIMGICGSAYTITHSELKQKKAEDELDGYKENTSSSKNDADEIDGCTDQGDDGSSSSSEDGDNEQSGSSQDGDDELDGRTDKGDNKNSSCSEDDDDEIDGHTDEEITKEQIEDILKNLCKIRREHEGITQDDNEKDNGNTSDFEDEDEDQLDGVFQDNFQKLALNEDRSWRAAGIHNFLRKVSTTAIFASDPIEKFLQYIKEQETMMFIDAGIAQNSPYPLLFQPGRDIDLILSFDFTDRHKDGNPPFKMLKKAEQWAKVNQIRFPVIDINPFKGKGVEEVYVFEGEDVNCPTIMHFVLVNKDFCVKPKTGKQISDAEIKRLKNFKVYDENNYNCRIFNYTEQMFDDLANLAEHIVLNNIEKITDCIRKVIEKKRKK